MELGYGDLRAIISRPKRYNHAIIHSILDHCPIVLVRLWHDHAHTSSTTNSPEHYYNSIIIGMISSHLSQTMVEATNPRPYIQGSVNHADPNNKPVLQHEEALVQPISGIELTDAESKVI